jgi:hypothetical protein
LWAMWGAEAGSWGVVTGCLEIDSGCKNGRLQHTTTAFASRFARRIQHLHAILKAFSFVSRCAARGAGNAIKMGENSNTAKNTSDVRERSPSVCGGEARSQRRLTPDG